MSCFFNIGVSSRVSRTNEVHRCEVILQVMCSSVDNTVPPLLTHTFEEVTEMIMTSLNFFFNNIIDI